MENISSQNNLFMFIRIWNIFVFSFLCDKKLGLFSVLAHMRMWKELPFKIMISQNVIKDIHNFYS